MRIKLKKNEIERKLKGKKKGKKEEEEEEEMSFIVHINWYSQNIFFKFLWSKSIAIFLILLKSLLLCKMILIYF